MATYKILKIKNSPFPKPIEVVNDGYNLYFNCRHLFLHLHPVARVLFDYLCEHMRPTDNSIIIDTSLRQQFRDHLKAITSKKMMLSDSVVNKHIGSLAELALIIPAIDSSRSYYHVNPKYAFKGSKLKRLYLLESLIQERIERNLYLEGLVDQKPGK